MTDPNLIDRLTAKTKWAKKYIEKLEAIIKSISDSNEYHVRLETNHHTRDCTFYIVDVPDVPREVTLLAGDVLQNLRSSLDHLACHLVGKKSGIDAITSSTCFPIAGDATKYIPAFFDGKIKGMGQEAKDAIHAIKPYKGGNDTLWRLHALNRIDKHRLLLTACLSHRGHSITPSERAKMEERFRGSHPGDPVPDLRSAFMAVIPAVPLKPGDKLITLPHSELQPNMKFMVDVAFDERKIIECKPIVEALHEMSEVVLNIILEFSWNDLL